MKDIGLGILDPYTVVIVLITLVLAQVLFGYQIPLDSTNATQLFVSLVIFTGYLYAARSLLRLPVAIARVLISNRELVGITKSLNPFYILRPKDVLYWLRALAKAILFFPFFILWFLFLVLDFAEDKFFKLQQSAKMQVLNNKGWLYILLKFLDRLSVILIAFVAVIPQFQSFVMVLGMIGISLMILVYLFKGNFSALIEDELEKRAQQNEITAGNEPSDETTKKQTEDQILHWGSIPVTVSRCLVCGKVCSENADGVLPKLCSLECFQKWTINWEKDWCIGDGDERKLLNKMRQSGYLDIREVDQTVTRFEEISTVNALWALMAIVRDCSGRAETSLASIDEIKELAQKGIQYFAENKDFAAKVFNACTLDESPEIINVAAHMLSKYIDGFKVDDSHMEELLKSDQLSIRLSAIQILGKTNNREILLRNLGKGKEVPEEGGAILKALGNLRQEKAIEALKEAQSHKALWIRQDATSLLQRKFGIDSQEPEFAKDHIQCIRCGYMFSVSIPKDHDSLVYLPKLKWRLSRHSSREIIKCPSCNKYIVVAFTRLMTNENREKAQKEIKEREAPVFTEESILDRPRASTRDV